MTRDETVAILRAIAASFPTFKPMDMTETVNVWHAMLEDQDGKLILAALKTYIRTNVTGFAPSIGQLMEIAMKLTSPDELTGQQAWALVVKAMRNSSYNAVDEFNKLPNAVQKAVGSPSKLSSMATNDGYNESVESSNFLRAYQQVRERENEIKKTSPDVLALMEKSVKRLEGNK
jgi:hypothetical protein